MDYQSHAVVTAGWKVISGKTQLHEEKGRNKDNTPYIRQDMQLHTEMKKNNIPLAEQTAWPDMYVTEDQSTIPIVL